MRQVMVGNIGSDPWPTAVLTIVREMMVLADLANLSGEYARCIEITSQAYGVFDNHEAGLAPDAKSRIMAADLARWIGDHKRSAALLTGVWE